MGWNGPCAVAASTSMSTFTIASDTEPVCQPRVVVKAAYAAVALANRRLAPRPDGGGRADRTGRHRVVRDRRSGGAQAPTGPRVAVGVGRWRVGAGRWRGGRPRRVVYCRRPT